MAHSHLISLHGAKEIELTDDTAAGSPFRNMRIKLDDGSVFEIDIFAAKDSDLAKEIIAKVEG